MFACSFIFSSQSIQNCFAQGNTVLQGTVKESDYLAPKGPSLNANDLKNGRDAFGKNEAPSLPSVGQTFEPPKDAFDLPNNNSVATAKTNVPNIPGFVGDSVPAIPGLEQENGGIDQTPFNLSAEQQGAIPGQVEQNDPDNTPEMQLAWDQWHKRVAQAIYEKFNSLAQLAFQFSKPISCYATYTVTKDGRIINTKLDQPSPNVAFNALVIMVINSLSGQTDLLTFPAGSQRTFVSKAGMFTQNYGVQGFKYTMGDKETVPGHC